MGDCINWVVVIFSFYFAWSSFSNASFLLFGAFSTFYICVMIVLENAGWRHLAGWEAALTGNDCPQRQGGGDRNPAIVGCTMAAINTTRHYRAWFSLVMV